TEKQSIQHIPAIPKLPGATPKSVPNTTTPTGTIEQSTNSLFFFFLKTVRYLFRMQIKRYM
ncbi:MAG: hypothetical protein KAU84_03390, partial [Thermoplasmatales archaeon]|nr:hypothetical protein [Thermoplasmatales archaeon]